MDNTVGEVETFFDKQRRIERENLAFIRLLGEKDVEIARLREALQAIVVECDGENCIPIAERAKLRGWALKALAATQGGSGDKNNGS